MKILGLETSCDETAAAIVEDGVKILSSTIASSSEFHEKYGGIVPEIAARQQVKVVIPVISEALISPVEEIDTIAVTIGPGLIGSLLIGVETAKVLAWAWQKPLVPVNHLIGHVYGNFVAEVQNAKCKSQRIEFPAVVLIVSGGHTELVLIEDHGKLKWLGGTRDDAAGEAFDKVARILGLGFPGGPAIEKAALSGDPIAFNFPRPLIYEDGFDFSFSGLKTAVFRKVAPVKKEPLSSGSFTPADKAGAGTTSQEIADLSASFQQAVIDCLIHKTLKVAKKYQVKSILLAGGVAANQKLRAAMELVIKKNLPSTLYFQPSLKYCTDNAAMIASAAYFNFRPVPFEKIKAESNLPLF